MLADLENATSKVGLVVHNGKTKIMSNTQNQKTRNDLTVNGRVVEVLPIDATEKYLGRAFSFTETHAAEIKHRISAGWAKFHQHRDILCGKHYPIRDRLRFFEAVVTPTVLYASGTWTMTNKLGMELRTAQRRMLRQIVRVGRRIVADEASTSDRSEEKRAGADDHDEACGSDDDEELESYVDWIVRATAAAERKANDAKVSDWVRTQRRRKWELAGHIVRRTDGRWSRKSILWEPCGGLRKVGRPARRWSDCLEAFAKQKGWTSWTEAAEDRACWHAAKEEFSNDGW
jgi:hypothetical protein